MPIPMSEENMNATRFAFSIRFILTLALACFAAVACAAQSSGTATTSAQSKPSAGSAPQSKASTASATPGGKAFDTPQQAADALVKAAADYNVDDLMVIFGPDGHDIVEGGDQVQAKKNTADFAQDAQTHMSVQLDTSDPNVATIVVGPNDWPLPVPLVKKSGKWYFDAKAGKKEILYRRIGANELDAITVCRGYVNAQREYALTPHDGVNQYAQKIISTPGKQDGLYWKNEDGTSGGPIGEEIARAIEEGYNYGNVKQGGYHGYYFKILKGQGSAAPLGRISYVIEGVMIGGFALVAVPAEYRVTGVKTFIVSNDGIVYQKDLGPDSLKIAKEMEVYNPDKTWHPTDDGWPGEPDVAEQ
jgi:hypothetical protein